MANKSKAKGTAFETAVGKYVNDNGNGAIARRLPLSGAVDKGDLEIYVPGGRSTRVITVQCKAAKAFDLAGWLADTEAQWRAAGSDDAVLIVKAPGKSIGRAYVIHALENYVRTL